MERFSVSPAAMVTSPRLSSSPDPAQTIASTTQPAWLQGELQRRVELAAAATGMSVEAACEQWVRQGLERVEAEQASDALQGSGRCSLRTGSCSSGPVPLPVQQ